MSSTVAFSYRVSVVVWTEYFEQNHLRARAVPPLELPCSVKGRTYNYRRVGCLTCHSARVSKSGFIISTY